MVTTLPDMRFRIEEVAGRMPERIRWELVEGALHMMTPASGEHGKVAMRIGVILDRWVHPRKLGVIYAAETGFVLSRDPDTLRAPDAAFVRAERGEPADAGFIHGAPDLAVEVVSPAEPEPRVMEKARQWLDAGSQAVWIIWPRERRMTVVTRDAGPRQLHEADELDGEPVLPGFRCDVREIFE